MPKKDPCSELAKTITQLAMAHGEHPDVKTLDDVVARMQKDIPEIGRAEVVASIIEATTGYRDAATDLQKKLADLRREARNDKAVREAVAKMQAHVKAGTKPAPAQRKPAPEAIRRVREELAGLRRQIAAADPAKREAVKKRIGELEAAIARGEKLPSSPRPDAPPDLQALRDRRDELTRQMRANPDKRAALQAEIERVDTALKSGQYPPKAPPATRPAEPADIAAMRRDLAKKRRELEKLNPDRIARLAEREKADAVKARQNVRDQIAALEGHLRDGTVPTREPRAEPPPDLAALRAQRDELRARVMQADPARRDAVRSRIAELEDAIAKGEQLPKRPRPEAPADLAALRAQRDDLYRQMREADPALRAELRAKIAEADAAIKAGVYPAKPPDAARPVPADLAALRDELAKKRSELERLNPKRIEEARARVAELEQHLRDGTLPQPKEGPTYADPPELVALRDDAERLRQAIARSEPALRQKFEQQIRDLTARLEDGVEPPGPKVEPAPLSRELERLQFERDKLRRQVRDQIDALQPRTFWRKQGDRAVETLNLARAVMTSLDFSAVLRQGGFITLGNPVRAARALGPMFRSFASEQAAYRYAKAIDARPNRPLYERAKLYLAEDVNAAPNKQEEAFMSRLAGKLPLIAGSQRAYNTFLNQIRADTFDAMAETLARNGRPTDAEAKAIANYINVVTGRPSLGATADQAGPLLGAVFFAPRYVASRFMTLSGAPLIGVNAATRKLIAAEYAKFLTGVGVVLGLGALAGAEIESDPRSSDFGKMKFGDTRLDPLAGLAQVTTLISRVASGETKTASGQIKPLRGPDVKFGQQNTESVITRFLRTKLAPVPSALLDRATGKDVVGEPQTPTQTLTRMVVPIGFGDIRDAMEEHGVAKGSALSALALFGMGLQTYKDKKKEPTR